MSFRRPLLRLSSSLSEEEGTFNRSVMVGLLQWSLLGNHAGRGPLAGWSRGSPKKGVTSAYEVIHATKVGLTKKKRSFVKGANLPISSEAAVRNKGGMDARVPKAWVPSEKAVRPKCPPTDETSVALEKLRRIFKQRVHWRIFCEEGVLVGAALIHDQGFDLSGNLILWGEILLAAKETVVKKAASSPRPSTTVELPPSRAQVANPTPHSSPTMVEPNPSSSLPNMDLPHAPSSSSLAGKRPSDEAILQGNEKRARGTFELSDPLRMFLIPPYTLPRGQQICVDTPFRSNLQSFHTVRPLLLEGLCERYSNASNPLEVVNADFELVRRADCLGEDNKDLKA
ncbi:hypothetical protein LIER_36534 [Lithospermum erythrorhizon]|uniref:Uncharacterized protein n=1 Tax=Lithospermum erythrorhizon TaxID=34254 RepID=A0AAV3PBZ5_LITER